MGGCVSDELVDLLGHLGRSHGRAGRGRKGRAQPHCDADELKDVLNEAVKMVTEGAVAVVDVHTGK